MRDSELESGLDIEENEEKDVFEEAEPFFEEEAESVFEEAEEDYDKEDRDKEETELYRKSSGKNMKTGGAALAEFGSFLIYIGAAVLITFLVLHFVGQRTVVNGPSMQNTLHDKDNIILDKISYRFHEPERFDVIVFPVENEEKNYIKRIIGLPGETVQIVNGFVYITDKDGKFYELEESYGAEIMFDDEGNYMTTEPVKLGDDEYFVLGDNRNNSIDSRRIGPIKRDIIIGRAWVRIYPFDAMGKIK